MPQVAARLSCGPEPGESLLGYLLRLTEMKGFPKPSWLFSFAGLPLSDHALAATKPSDLTRLASFAGVEKSALEVLANWPAARPNMVHFRSTELRAELITLRHRRVCPLCLIEAPYHRSFWDMSIVTACPRHGIKLLRFCPGCLRALNWRAATPYQCHCGTDLRNGPLFEAPGPSIDGLRALANFFTPGCGVPDASSRIWFAFQLGALVTGRLCFANPVTLLAAGEDTSVYLAVGLEALRGGHCAYFDRLAFGTAGEVWWRYGRAARLLKDAALESECEQFAAEIALRLRVQ